MVWNSGYQRLPLKLDRKRLSSSGVHTAVFGLVRSGSSTCRAGFHGTRRRFTARLSADLSVRWTSWTVAVVAPGYVPPSMSS
jgi:hypothetical protein